MAFFFFPESAYYQYNSVQHDLFFFHFSSQNRRMKWKKDHKLSHIAKNMNLANALERAAEEQQAKMQHCVM